jgi:hypothetical protein
VNRRLAQLALSLYPVAFRRRYGEEMRVLLDDAPPRRFAVLDLLRGAIAAHLRPVTSEAGLLDPSDRLRASASGQLACWVAFAAAGFGFYKTTEDEPFAATGHAHHLLGAAYLAVQILAVLASAAVVLGALPLILRALARARVEPRVRRLVILPPLFVLVFVGLTWVLELLTRSEPAHHGSTVGGIAFIGWVIAALACGTFCVVAARAALFAVTMARWRLLAAYGCGTLVTVAMSAITLAATLYAVALFADAPSLAASGNGPFQLVSVGVSLVAQLLVMVLSATLAATSTRRGWNAVALD